jgi:hypothetical protein
VPEPVQMGTLGLTASKGILVRRSRMIRNFYPPPLLDRIVIQIDIRALVEAVVRGSTRRRREVVMDVCEATRLYQQNTLDQTLTKAD